VRTYAGRYDVARTVVFGNCIRVQMPASSSFASVSAKAKVEKAPIIRYLLV